MRFYDPFTGEPVDVEGFDLEGIFAGLVDEPPIHDHADPEECSLCGPLLVEAAVADAHPEIEAA